MPVHIDNDQSMNAPPGKFVSVYTAAKLIHASMLVGLRKNWPRLYFTARWPLTANLPTEQAKPASLWTRDNEDDIIRADVFLAYAHPDDVLRDLYTELGIAHAHRKPIYLAGPITSFGGYASCSSVVRHFETLEPALQEVSDRINYKSHADDIRGQLTGLKEQLERIEAAVYPEDKHA